jgi:alpha-tubulin suppressor-like RCC1 family protein
MTTILRRLAHHTTLVLIALLIGHLTLAGCDVLDPAFEPATLAPPAAPALLSVPATPQGGLVSWGYNGEGQVSNTPGGADFVAVAAGRGHSVAIRADGSLVSWGWNDYNEVSNTPGGTGFVAVAAGFRHSVAIRANGSLVSWGFDSFGQVGNTPSGTGFVAVAAGFEHSVAIRADGSLVSWGRTDVYNLESDTPPGIGFMAVAAGSNHNVAIRADGSLASWGWNASGQVSNMPGGTGFVAVSAGHSHSVALRADGSLVSWGSNLYNLVSNTPAGTGFVAVSAGYSHSVALRADGSLVSWGNDEYTQVSNTPAGTGFVAVAAGNFHSVAIRGPVAAQVTLDIPAPSPYDGNPRVVTAITDPAGLTVAITYGGSTTAPTNAGNYEVVGTITSAGYAGSATGTLTILPAAQAISFTSTPPAPAVVGGSYAVSATGGASGQPVLFSSLTPAVCSVTGSSVGLDAAGTCTVAADQAGSTNYAAAPQATQTFTVEASTAVGIQRPGIDIEDVAIASATRAGTGMAEGSFVLRNTSGGTETLVTLGEVSVSFRSAGRGTRTNHTATCIVGPSAATGYVLQPGEAGEFTYSCTAFSPTIPASAGELTAVVTVAEMWNQLGARRAGPPPTSSEPFRF